jgi:membrane protein implicated in regulation of membrane protease activity
MAEALSTPSISDESCMIKQIYNSKVIVSLVIGLLAIPCGLFGWFGMFWVGTLSSVYIPHAISVMASIIAILVARMGLKEIETHRDTQKGRGVGISSIAISALNFVLLVFYYASY